MKKAVIYSRVSTKDQEREGYSIPAQVRILKDYAEKNSLKVVEEFKDTESAGKAGRTAFSKMVQFLKSDKSLNVILVEKTDRLYRNFKDQVIIDDLGVEIHFVKDNRIISKDSKPSDVFVHDIETAQARFYLNNLSQEVKKGMDQKARQGQYPSGAIPIGYVRNKLSKQIEIDPDRSNKIRLLFEKYLEGDDSLWDILQYSKEINLTYPRSGRFLVKAEIDRILKRIFYTGRFEWKGQVIKGDHPQIISTELFDKVQDVITGRAKGKMSKKDFTFRRLMRCGECENVITAQIKKQKYIYYHCTGYGSNHKKEYVAEKIIDSQFSNVIKRITIPYDWYEFLKTSLEKEFSGKKIQIARERERLELQRDQIENDMRKSFKAKIDGLIDDNFFRSVHNDYKKQLDSVNYRLSNLSESIGNKVDIALKTIELSYQAESLYLRANSIQKRRLLKSVLSNCHLKNATLYPTYNKAFNVFAEGLVANKKRGRRDSNSRPPA